MKSGNKKTMLSRARAASNGRSTATTGRRRSVLPKSSTGRRRAAGNDPGGILASLNNFEQNKSNDRVGNRKKVAEKKHEDEESSSDSRSSSDESSVSESSESVTTPPKSLLLSLSRTGPTSPQLCTGLEKSDSESPGVGSVSTLGSPPTSSAEKKVHKDDDESEASTESDEEDESEEEDDSDQRSQGSSEEEEDDDDEEDDETDDEVDSMVKRLNLRDASREDEDEDIELPSDEDESVQSHYEKDDDYCPDGDGGDSDATDDFLDDSAEYVEDELAMKVCGKFSKVDKSAKPISSSVSQHHSDTLSDHTESDGEEDNIETFLDQPESRSDEYGDSPSISEAVASKQVDELDSKESMPSFSHNDDCNEDEDEEAVVIMTDSEDDDGVLEVSAVVVGSDSDTDSDDSIVKEVGVEREPKSASTPLLEESSLVAEFVSCVETKNAGEREDQNLDATNCSMSECEHESAQKNPVPDHVNAASSEGHNVKSGSLETKYGNTVQAGVSFAEASTPPRNGAGRSKSSRRYRREGHVKRGGWVLGSKIGSGAFGVVHVGMNTRTGTLMAVKSVKMDKAVMKDAQREIELLKTLNHQNIVRYLGAEMEGEDLHIFQEWVAGGSVTGMLSKFGPFSLPVVRSYLSQLLEGLAYLHENGIMHRDIKGSNILVSDDGIVKVADFGAGKKFESEMMQSHTMRGTPYFMAPEVFEERYTFKADIWSVGCVIVQMVSGTPPWKKLGFSNPVALFRHIKDHTGGPSYEILSQNDKRSTESLKDMISRCFRRPPEERPSARDLLAASFFSETHHLSDDEQSVDQSIMFSPSAFSLDALRSPGPMKTSPVGPFHGRRKSISAPSSPFLSPPLPRRPSTIKAKSPCFSPQVDVCDWPSWARESKPSTPGRHFGMDSLAYSDTSKGETPETSQSLVGVHFLGSTS